MGDIAQHWIDGQWISSGSVDDSINPANGEVLGRWYNGGEAEAASSISAAKRAYETTQWSQIGRASCRERV